MSTEEIHNLAYNALNTAVAEIQNKLGEQAEKLLRGLFR